MIPIQDIRVGLWFNLEFVGPFQWECSHFDEYVKDKAKGYDVQGCVVSDKVEPIELTGELLEKAGFILNKEFDCWVIETSTGEIMFSDEMILMSTDSITKVTTVHHLQNLIYCKRKNYATSFIKGLFLFKIIRTK